MNKIIIELAAEDRKRLDDILAALQNGPHCDKCVQTVAPPWEEGVPAETAEPAAPTYTKEEVRKKVVELCAAGHKTAVREIVNKYAPNVTEIPENKCDEVMEKLLQLEG